VGRRALAPGLPFDPVVVDLLVAGRSVPGLVAPADVWEAVRRLVRDDFSDGQIALRVRYTRRQIIRIRKAYGLKAPNRGLGYVTRLRDEPSIPYSAY
jgi:hypothetical protein